MVLAIVAAALLLANLAQRYAARTITAIDRDLLPVLALLFVVETAGAYGACRDRADHWRGGWLAMHWQPAHLLSALNRALLWRLAMRLIVVGLVAAFGYAAQPSSTWMRAGIGMCASLIAADVCAGLLMRRSMRRQAKARRSGDSARASARGVALNLKDSGLGAWQWAGLRVAWRTRASALMLAPGLLLLPGGEGPLLTLALLALAAGAALGLASWLQAMRRLLLAAAWLRAQPISPGALLAPLLLPPALLALGVSGVLGVLLNQLGVQAFVAAGAGLTIFGLALIHAACVAALRYQPDRIAMLFTGLTMLMLYLLQGYPPLALPAGCAALAILARRSLRA